MNVQPTSNGGRANCLGVLAALPAWQSAREHPAASPLSANSPQLLQLKWGRHSCLPANYFKAFSLGTVAYPVQSGWRPNESGRAVRPKFSDVRLAIGGPTSDNGTDSQSLMGAMR